MSGPRGATRSQTQPDDAPANPDERRIFSVGALLAGLNKLLDSRVGCQWVVGEISNLHKAGSGHCYFTLKDEAGQIKAALFQRERSRIPFELEEGMEVVVQADVTIYGARGELQLVVREVEPRGQGALQLAFEQLRRRLEAEGLFDPARKRPLPSFPRRVGVVTSPTSAAVRDVIHVAGLRFPAIPLLIAPTRVQGEGAPAEIAAALHLVSRVDDVDVVLLVRGGGSLEDLWAFNSEPVARAIADSPVPVLSGVGHETDFTIADFVADDRAPTPSAAAARALPDRAALQRLLRRDFGRLDQAARAQVLGARRQLQRRSESLRTLAPRARLATQRARLDASARALWRSGEALAERRRERLSALVGRLESLSPLAVLGRGYALVRNTRDDRIVRSPADVAPGDRLRVRVASAELEAVAESVREVPGNP